MADAKITAAKTAEKTEQKTEEKAPPLTAYTVKTRGGVLHQNTTYRKGDEIKLDAEADTTKALLSAGKIGANADEKTTEAKA